MSLIAAIFEREPVSLSTLQPVTPPSLERLVKRCLAKSPDDRWECAHDVADELRWIGQAGLAPAATGRGPATRRWRWGLVVGGLALVASAILGGIAFRRLLAAASPRPFVVRSLLDIGPAEAVKADGASSVWLPTPGGSRTALTWTPDGRSLVFVGWQGGVQRLYVRALDGDEARPLGGTESAQVPAVSPDGRWVAFWANGAIRRVPLAGGPAAVLGTGMALAPCGMTWGQDGRLFYAAAADADGAIWSVEPERAPTALTKRLDGEVSHGLQQALPGGRALLYTVRHREWTWGDEEVVAHIFVTGERKVLLKDAADARYVTSGHLVFLRRGVLHAVGFDAERLEVRGTPAPVLDAVAQVLTGGNSKVVTGAGQFTVSSTGALAYVRGAVAPYPDAQLVAVDRQGRVSPLDAPTRSYSGTLGLSPDGRYLAIPIDSLTERALWLYDRERSTLSKLTPGGETIFPRWAPDGQRESGSPSSWSPDGRHLAFVRDYDIWIATIENGKAAVEPLARTADIQGWPEFSPDGRWLAFGSTASGRYEVYVQPYPGPGPRQQVSLEGGDNPAWSPTGRELFFLSLPDSKFMAQMMVADVRPGLALAPGKPRRLFGFSSFVLEFDCGPARCFAVAPDGERFYVQQYLPAPPPAPVTQIHLILNWTEELKAPVPSGSGR